MIIFNTISFNNFLSVGDKPTIIQLDKTITSVVMGTNGSGKSTFIDALTYALYGKPFRKVKLGQLINKINEKGLLTEVTFTIGSKQYKIIRGQKPAIFEIYVNNELIEQPATTAEYQAILENEILKLNYQTFTQISVLGSASYTPFMSLKLADRREIIENLLDISVFSQMNKILKGKIKEKKGDLVEIQHNIELSKEKYTLKRTHHNEDTHKRETAIEEYNTKIVSIDADIDSATKELRGRILTLKDIHADNTQYDDVEDGIIVLNQHISETKQEISAKETEYKTLDDNNTNIETDKNRIEELSIAIKDSKAILKKRNMVLEESTKELEDTPDPIEEKITHKERLAVLGSKLKDLETKIEFYETHDECPECTQEISLEFSADIVYNCRSLLHKYKEESKTITSRLKDISYIQTKRATLQSTKSQMESAIKNGEFEITDWENTKTNIEKLAKDTKTCSPDELDERKDGIILLKATYVDLKEKLSSLIMVMDKKKEHQQKTNTATERVSLAEQQLENSNNLLKTTIEEFGKLKSSPVSSITEAEIEELYTEIKELDALLLKAKHVLHYFEIVRRLLKDDGIKTLIINKFLPVINATVNKYLDMMDFPINFTFDENFNETIQSKHRNDFSYHSFSEGEKSRIDLSLLFTWRDISLKKSRNAANLIIFDEIFDGSLDMSGVENFIDILGLNTDVTNSIIISHKDDIINSRFDRIIEFKKDGHFSTMSEN